MLCVFYEPKCLWIEIFNESTSNAITLTDIMVKCCCVYTYSNMMGIVRSHTFTASAQYGILRSTIQSHSLYIIMSYAHFLPRRRNVSHVFVSLQPPTIVLLCSIHHAVSSLLFFFLFCIALWHFNMWRKRHKSNSSKIIIRETGSETERRRINWKQFDGSKKKQPKLHYEKMSYVSHSKR